jgi:hypothetical protein
VVRCSDTVCLMRCYSCSYSQELLNLTYLPGSVLSYPDVFYVSSSRHEPGVGSERGAAQKSADHPSWQTMLSKRGQESTYMPCLLVCTQMGW